VILTATAMITASAATAAWAVRGRSSNLLAPVRWRGEGGSRQIALTFDDGPSESTPDLLAVLAQHRVRATFFVCGFHARRLPGIARAIHEGGHELGNHTETHPPFYFKTAGFMRRELEQAQRSIQEVTGCAPRYYRPTYGVRWPGLGGVLRDLGLEAVMWSAIGSDWRLPAPAITRRLTRAAFPGAILCLHDGRELALRPDITNTVAAVRDIIPALSDAGYSFRPISELFAS
jgi:peptidoglycan/xylan/chitin deacetylase (PgdA/CDA1 family)